MNNEDEKIKRVTIGFRHHDIENINIIAELSASSTPAHAVSISISLARYFMEAIARGEQILIRNKDGEIERVTIPYINPPKGK